MFSTVVSYLDIYGTCRRYETMLETSENILLLKAKCEISCDVMYVTREP